MKNLGIGGFRVLFQVSRDLHGQLCAVQEGSGYEKYFEDNLPICFGTLRVDFSLNTLLVFSTPMIPVHTIQKSLCTLPSFIKQVLQLKYLASLEFLVNSYKITGNFLLRLMSSKHISCLCYFLEKSHSSRNLAY